jgi:acyl-CoA thioesterase FadM
MTWSETYRGTVPPWECDVTEHFTIAYYFDRLVEAERNLAEMLGLREFLRAGTFARRYDVRFVRELRAASSFHIDSAAITIAVDGGLRLAHRFVDSANGQPVTWIQETWELPPGSIPLERREAIADRFVVVWEGPAIEQRPEPKSFEGFVPTARGRVKPTDLGADGRFGLAAIVHRFTDACIQAGAQIGMDAEYLEKSRRGLSTFELGLRITGSLAVDVPYLVETGIGHMGNSSVRYLHRMTDPGSGAEVARLSQYAVNLDLDARRPALWPDEIRARGAAAAVPVG